jgi:competence protein ComEC
VAVLYWGTRHWLRREDDALRRLEEENWPMWWRGLVGLGRRVVLVYVAALAVWLAQAPLVAADRHVIAPLGVVTGPPLMLLALVALVWGFLLLATYALCPPLAFLPAWPMRGCLTAIDWVVTWSAKVPCGHGYFGDIPQWWLWGFYLGLLAFLLVDPVRRCWRWVLPAGLVWLCVGLLGMIPRGSPDELRCTFLAVGHGGCAVLETPDGRVLLYDAGALGGPEVTRRHIAPFLWSRGIRRIDEVLLSHT